MAGWNLWWLTGIFRWRSSLCWFFFFVMMYWWFYEGKLPHSCAMLDFGSQNTGIYVFAWSELKTDFFTCPNPWCVRRKLPGQAWNLLNWPIVEFLRAQVESRQWVRGNILWLDSVSKAFYRVAVEPAKYMFILGRWYLYLGVLMHVLGLGMPYICTGH